MGGGDLISLRYKCNRSQDYPQPFCSSAPGLPPPCKTEFSPSSMDTQKLSLFSHLGSLVSIIIHMAENERGKHHIEIETKD